MNEKPLNIVKDLNIGRHASEPLKDIKDPDIQITPSLGPSLNIIIKNGRGFLSPTEISENPSNNLSVHIYFQGHRYESKPALSQSDPLFNINWGISIQVRYVWE